MQIVQKFIPPTNKKTRPGLPLTPEYITIHETDNTDPGANALAHANLQYNGNVRTASWHFTVDDGDIIYQSLPVNEVGWHAGDGYNGTGNRKSIAIELCVNQGSNFEKTKQNAAWLVRKLMKELNIPIERVVPHHHWSGKNCPRNILPNWNNMIASIQSVDEPTKLPTAPSPKPSVSLPTGILRTGSRGDAVKQVQTALNKLGFPCGSVDGVYGPKTYNAVKSLQTAYHLTPDGIYGPKTRAEMLRHLV